MSDLLLTPEQVAERLRKSQNTLRRWRAEQINLPFRKYGRSVYYLERDVEEYENRQVVQPRNVSRGVPADYSHA